MEESRVCAPGGSPPDLHSWSHPVLRRRALCHMTDGLLKSHFSRSDIRFIASVLSPGNVSRLQSWLDVKWQRGETQTGCNWHYFHSFCYNVPLLLVWRKHRNREAARLNHSSRGQKPNSLGRCDWLIASFTATQPLVIQCRATEGVCTPKRMPNERQKAARGNASTKWDDLGR